MKPQLAFDIVLPFAEIAKSLNKHLAPLLYEGTVEQPEQAPMSLKVVREGSIQVKQTDEVLVIEANVHVWVKIHRKRGLFDIWKDLPGVRVEETDFNLQVKFYTNIQLEANWQLTSHTVGNFTWMRKPKVGLGLLNLNVSQIVAPILQNQIDSLASQIDEFVIREIDLPTKVQAIWDEVCEPYQLSEEWISYFLLFTPDTRLNVDGLFWNTHQISFNVTTDHTPSFYVQHTPPPFELSGVKLFNIEPARNNIATRYHIYLQVEDIVSYLKNQTIDVSPSISILICSSSIQIKDGQYLLDLDIQVIIENRIFNTTFEGNVVLTFQLKLGHKEQWMILELQTYQLASPNYLLQWWNQLKHASLSSQLEGKLNLWLREIQTDLISHGNDFLSGTEIHTHAYLYGKVKETRPIDSMQSGNILVLILESDLGVHINLHGF